MSYAASRGRKALRDKFTKEIVWIEGPADHTPPVGRFQYVESVMIHEPMTEHGFKGESTIGDVI